MSVTKERIVCDDCKGEGVEWIDELTNYHKREYDTWSRPCRACEGSGLIVKTTSVAYAPYKPLQPQPRTA